MERARFFNGEVCPYCGGTQFTEERDEQKRKLLFVAKRVKKMDVM